MKKRVLAVLLASVLALALAGCGGSKSSGTAEQTEEPGETAEDAGKETGPSGTEDAEPAEGGEEAAPAGEAETDASLPYQELVPVMTYEEYAAAAVGSPVTVETFVQARQAYDTEKSAVSLYAQDEAGAYYIDSMSVSQADCDRLTEGQKIRVSGTKSGEGDETWIGQATCEIGDGTYIADPVDVTDLLGTDELAKYRNRRIAIRGVKSVDTEDPGGDLLRFLYDTDGNGDPGDDLYFSIDRDGQSFLLIVESSLTGPDTEVYQAVTTVEEDAIVDLEGFLPCRTGQLPQITVMTVQ